MGVTETEAKARGIDVRQGHVPVGRERPLARASIATRASPSCCSTRRRTGCIGGGIVGTNAGELIAEVGLAIEMGADAADIGLTIHAHPTLSETVAFAAEAFEGTLTDLYIPKREADRRISASAAARSFVEGPQGRLQMVLTATRGFGSSVSARRDGESNRQDQHCTMSNSAHVVRIAELPRGA